MTTNHRRAPIIFIVDDDDAVRSALKLLLRSHDLPSTAFALARDFLEAYDLDQPGCVLLDVRMPDLDGLELQRELSARGAVIPVIFITGHGDIPMAVEAISRGAFDFLQKPFNDYDLVDRVRRALVADVVRRMKLTQTTQIRARLHSLTLREQQILRRVTVGQANKVMAADLGVSQRTVEIHRAHLMQKMEAASLAELVRMVILVDESGAEGSVERHASR